MASKEEAKVVVATTPVTFDGSLDLLSDLKVSGTILGLETLEASDMKLPRIKLMQPTSAEVTKQQATAGFFYNTITKKQTKELHCTLLVLGKSRVQWKAAFKRGEEPVCKSLDSIMSESGIKCETCNKKEWIKEEGTEDKKPLCNMSYVWLGVNHDESNAPFRIVVPGMSVSPTKDFLNSITPKRLPPFVYKITLTSEFKENDQGAFYVIKYNLDGNIVDDIIVRLGYTIEEIKSDPVKAAKFSDERKSIMTEFEDLSESLKHLFSKVANLDIVAGPDSDDGTTPNGAGGLF